LETGNSKPETYLTWFKRESSEIEPGGEKRVRTEGLWVKCDNCRQVIWKKDLDQNWNVCTKCDRHFRIDARTRLALLLDGPNGQPNATPSSASEADPGYKVEDTKLASTDPLRFVDV